MTRRTVSRWEQNSSKPNGDELKRLATLLGVTEDEILSDEDDLIRPSKDAGQNILGKISDSVDNLVTGQEIINERLANNRDEYIDKQEGSRYKQYRDPSQEDPDYYYNYYLFDHFGIDIRYLAICEKSRTVKQ